MNKYINLNLRDRFVATSTLRAAYLQDEGSLNPTAAPYLSFAAEDFELGIVSSQTNEIASASISRVGAPIRNAISSGDVILSPPALQVPFQLP